MTPDPRHRLVPTGNASLNLQPSTSPLRSLPVPSPNLRITALLGRFQTSPQASRCTREPAKDSGDGRELFPSPVLLPNTGDTSPLEFLPSMVTLAQGAESALVSTQKPRSAQHVPTCWSELQHMHRRGQQTHGNKSDTSPLPICASIL